MTKPLNVLILTWLGNPARRRYAVEELEFRLPLVDSQNNYIFHDLDYPVTDELKRIEFDFIYIGPTFLCLRNQPHFRKTLYEKYKFIEESDAVKFVFPQDDYNRSALLDEWFCLWDVDALFSILPEDSQQFYPNFCRLGRPIYPAYTGYISGTSITHWCSPLPFEQRQIDVSYRASKPWPNLNGFADLKGEFAQRFVSNYEKLGKYSLKIDVDTGVDSMITGDDWLSFIENSRFCLATKSGSDHHDPWGYYSMRAAEIVAQEKNINFTQLRDKVSIADSHKKEFTALSPRNLEAGLANTAQLAVPGGYNGIMQEDQHYIPLNSDCGNLDEVLEKMQDPSFVQKIVRTCKETLLSVDGLRMEKNVELVLTLAKERCATKHVNSTTTPEEFRKYRKQYWNHLLSLDFKPSISFSHLFNYS